MSHEFRPSRFLDNPERFFENKPGTAGDGRENAMSTAFLVKFFGLFLGVLARTILPWLRKVKEGKVRGFSRRYVYSALASLAIGLILTLILFPKFEAGAEGETFEALFKLFGLAFGFGFGWNALINEGGAWAAKPEVRGEEAGGEPWAGSAGASGTGPPRAASRSARVVAVPTGRSGSAVR